MLLMALQHKFLFVTILGSSHLQSSCSYSKVRYGRWLRSDPFCLRLCLFQVKKEIWKIFYTLECVWVHMKMQSNWKYISVDCKLRPLDPEIFLHIDFTFNQFPLSSLTHTKPKELGRSYPRSSLCPPLVKPVPTCLLLPIFLLSLSLQPTKVGSDTACHRSSAFT